MPCLLITVGFLDGRYHGLEPNGHPEWPPTPARLFQALVAAAARGAGLAEEDKQALAWLERLDPPLIAAPARHKGQSFRHFMPNNDMNAVGGDPARMSEIRTAPKRFHPQIFDRETPFLYVWSFDNGREHAERLREIALRLYQLGRGVDMAWATAENLDDEEVRSRLDAHPGTIHRPTNGGAGRGLACPIPGSLESLIDRHEKGRARFKPIIEVAPTKKGPSRKKVAGQTFAQPPKPKFRKVFYDSPSVQLPYELHDMTTKDVSFLTWPLRKVVRLVETVRDNAAERLKQSLEKTFPNKAAIVERVFGLRRDAIEVDKTRRIRIIPLPSIGHQHADHGVRRLLVEIPPDCPLAAKDIEWAFSATGAIDHDTGEIRWMLVPAEERNMLGHYGIGDLAQEDVQTGFRMWRTVTPMALPIPRPHGRKKASERADIERSATFAVAQALRHAGISVKPVSIRAQREPFDAKGLCAEGFASGTRFPAARLWHVEITFFQPVLGPLVVGDGRYLGLGLMRPVSQPEGVHAFVIAKGLTSQADPWRLTQALRRAVMALVQSELGPGITLPTFFTGHEVDGSPARRGGRAHLAFAFDKARRRLLIIAPHLLEGRQPNYEEREYLRLLDSALTELRELRAGSAGLFKLEPAIIIEDEDPMFAQAMTWATQTEYRTTRHSKGVPPERAVIADVALELRRRGLPVPKSIETISVVRGPKGGLSAQLRVMFSKAVKGPLLLGKTSNFGGGLFVGVA